MKNTKRLDGKILGDIRENLGLDDREDTSKDNRINSMDCSELLDRVASWNNLIGYGGYIKKWVEEIYNIKLDNIEKDEH